MWNWQLSSKVTFTNAVRLDRLTLNYAGTGLEAAGITPSQVGAVSHSAVSFNSALVWALSPVNTIRLIGARGLELPSLADLGALTPLGPHFYIAGDPRLAPTAVTSVEISYDRNLPIIFSTLHAAVFAERNDNMFPPTGALNPYFKDGFVLASTANIGHSDEEGGEFDLKGSLPLGLRWNASYALAAITDHFDKGTPDRATARFTGTVPRHTGIAGVGYSTGPWDLDLNARWQSHFVTPSQPLAPPLPPGAIAGFLTVDARLGYRLTKNITAAVSRSIAARAYPRGTGLAGRAASDPLPHRASVTMHLRSAA